MKKFGSVVLGFILLFNLCCVTTFAAKSDINTKTYNIPLRETPPVIDGVANDAAWNGAYEVKMSISEANATGGWVKYQGKGEGAVGTISMVWSNKGDEAGLYFKCVVTDPTHGWAIDVLAPGPQYESLSDGFQVFIDPMYARRTSIKNTAMRFNFVPYRCMSGNGMCPTESCGWWESWQWASNYAGSGVQMAATLDKEDDASMYRVYFVHGYTIEAFLPWSSLNVNFKQPEGYIGEKMGIGLAMHDIDWDKDQYIKDNSGGEYNPVNSIIEVNYFTDFGNGKNKLNYPNYYNTLILADANGVVPQDTQTGGNEETNTEQNEENAEEKAAALEALIAVVDKAKADYTENEEAKEKYTQESMQAVIDAVAKAAEIGESNTIDEINAAKTAVDEAIAGLALNNVDQTDQDETNSELNNVENENKTETEESNNNLLLIIIIVSALVVIAVVIVVVILVVKKKRNSAETEMIEGDSEEPEVSDDIENTEFEEDVQEQADQEVEEIPEDSTDLDQDNDTDSDNE